MKKVQHHISFLLVSFYLVQMIFISDLYAQNESEILKQKLNAYLSDYRKDKLIPGISAGISVNNNIFWLGTAGQSDVENNVPVTTSSHFRIASVSKSITAVAIIQLVEKGRIKLDEDARKYIPYFPKKKWKFTVRQLLNHTAGIRNYYYGEFDDTKHYSNIKEAVGIISKDTLAYKPGTKYLYTTLGYNLLGAIIENVSGLSFGEYLKRNIFIPAEMNSTFLDIQYNIVHDRTHYYTRNDYRILENAPLADLSNKYPGGGIISTSEDLLKFASALQKGLLIKAEYLDTMLVPVRLANGTKINYGLGFTLGSDYKGRKYLAHEGYKGTSLLVIYPELKLAAVDLINIRDRNNGTLASDLAYIYLQDTIAYPKALLSDRLMSVQISSGIDSAMLKFKELTIDSSENYDVSLNEVSAFGYDLLNINRTSDAIKYFKFIITQFPLKSKPYIGLADAYFKDGNLGLALRNYRLAFRIEPTNAYALGMIKKLSRLK